MIMNFLWNRSDWSFLDILRYRRRDIACADAWQWTMECLDPETPIPDGRERSLSVSFRVQNEDEFSDPSVGSLLKIAVPSSFMKSPRRECKIVCKAVLFCWRSPSFSFRTSRNSLFRQYKTKEVNLAWPNIINYIMTFWTVKCFCWILICWWDVKTLFNWNNYYWYVQYFFLSKFELHHIRIQPSPASPAGPADKATSRTEG